MFLPHIILSVIFFTTSSHAAPSSLSPPNPCKPDDTNCMTAATKSLFQKFLAGDKSIGAEPADPMLVEEIDGSPTVLKYKMTNTTFSGFNKCQIKDLKHDKSQMSFVVKITCPHLDIGGNYEMDGKLIVLPVKGKGKYTLAMDVYDTVITATYKIVQDDNGKEHVTIKSYQVDGEPKKGVKFDFQNLFNGNKDLANTVQKFANENWKEVTVQFQGPIITSAFKKMIRNANKFLKAMPMDKVFL